MIHWQALGAALVAIITNAAPTLSPSKARAHLEGRVPPRTEQEKARDMLRALHDLPSENPAFKYLYPPEPIPRFSPPAPPPRPELRWGIDILVCVYPNPSLTPELTDEMRQSVSRAAGVWNGVANVNIQVRFVQDEDECRQGPWIGFGGQPSLVRAELLGDDMAFASADGLGNELNSGKALRFATSYPWNDRICGDDGTAGPAQCRFGDAVHEFGHLLGFSHDHLSINAPDCIDLNVSMEQRQQGMTYYDPKSVMNYCNVDRWKGELSPADICSVRVAYPFTNMDPVTEQDCYRLAMQARLALRDQ